MTPSKWLATILVVGCTTSLPRNSSLAHEAQNEPTASPALSPATAAPKSAPSRVTAVTVYQGNALVTREVNVAEGKGLVEISGKMDLRQTPVVVHHTSTLCTHTHYIYSHS